MNFKFMVVFKFANSHDELDTCDCEFLKGKRKGNLWLFIFNVNLKSKKMKRNNTVYLAINNLDNIKKNTKK